MEGAVKVFKSMAGLYPSVWEKVAAFLLFIGLAIVGNKLVCGWACPFGALQELLYSLPILKRINVRLAQNAGLEIGTTGAIKVDQHMRTSDPDICAAGDCAECQDLLTGKSCYVPLGSTANKQGRVAANNICGEADTFPGVLGSTVCRVFDYCFARTGLSEAAAGTQGYSSMAWSLL